MAEVRLISAERFRNGRLPNWFQGVVHRSDDFSGFFYKEMLMKWVRSIDWATRIQRMCLAAGCVFALAHSASAAIISSEVDPSGSSMASNTYNADWFELTNTGASAQDITGWKMDDNSHTFGSAVGLRGVTSIAPGQSVVFVE